jgi:hypothetical protein
VKTTTEVVGSPQALNAAKVRAIQSSYATLGLWHGDILSRSEDLAALNTQQR